MSIVYIQDSHPHLIETFLRAEISELYRRSYPVYVATFNIIEDVAQKVNYKDNILLATPETIVEKVRSVNPKYLHCHFATEAAQLTLPIAEQLGIPFGFVCHAYDIWLRGARLEPEVLSQLGNHPLCKIVSSIGSKHISYLKSCGIPEEKLVVVPNCVDQEAILAPSSRGARPLKKLCMVGRPVPKKGFLVAIDAIRLLHLQGHKDITLEIIGGADLERPYGQVVKTYCEAFPFVQSVGKLGNKETLEKIREADALLAPCVIADDGDSDGIPTVLAEAMLMNVPVISTDVGSVTDLVQDEKTGLIARVGDSASLAQQILRLTEIMSKEDTARNLLVLASRQAKAHLAASAVNSLAAKLEKQVGRF